MEKLNIEELYCTKSFWKKQSQRMRTWKNPDSHTKNETDFILTNKKAYYENVWVFDEFDTCIDHRFQSSALKISLTDPEMQVQYLKKKTTINSEFSKNIIQLSGIVVSNYQKYDYQPKRQSIKTYRWEENLIKKHVKILTDKKKRKTPFQKIEDI